jgi:hypothetical protein
MKAELKRMNGGREVVLQLCAESELESIALRAWVDQSVALPSNDKTMPMRFVEPAMPSFE